MASDNQYTFVQLCNATGCTLIYTGQIDWHGGIGPAPYPQSIANGEQGWFLHVRSASQPGSEGAVCYRGVDANRTEFIWIVYWINPFNSQNKVTNLDLAYLLFYRFIHICIYMLILSNSLAVYNCINYMFAYVSFYIIVSIRVHIYIYVSFVKFIRYLYNCTNYIYDVDMQVFAVVLPSSSNVDWDRIRQEIAGTDSTNGDFTGYFTHASIDIDGNFPTAKAVVTKNANN